MLRGLASLFGRRSSVDAAKQAPPESKDDPAELQARLAAGWQALNGGRLAEAEASFQTAVELKHDCAEAHYGLGLALSRMGRYEDAADSLVLATCFAPRMSRAHYALALVERAQGRPDDALESVERALGGDRADADAYILRGALLLDAGDIDGSIASFESAIELDPDNAVAHANLGYVLFRDRGELEAGGRHIERALSLDPSQRATLCNYTMLLHVRGELEQAIDLASRLLRDDPHLNEARLNRALCLLQLGRFGEGWDDYEARKLVRCNYVPRKFDSPEWKGQALCDESLLVFGEQGIGDEIMFASCYADVLARAPRLVMECTPRLRRLFQRSFPGATVYSCGETPSPGAETSYHVAAGSLPRLFRRSWSDFPDHRGYLVPDAAKRAGWQKQLAALGPGLKVGLAWRGGMVSTRRHLRSISLDVLAPLLQIPGVHWIDLQYGDTNAERAQLHAETGLSLHRWQHAIDDFDEAAALVSCLDLVVSVCSAAVHLAGALGTEVWVMVPRCPEWRYLAQGERMPWYPSARLVRQDDGGWAGVVARIEEALRERSRGSRC